MKHQVVWPQFNRTIEVNDGQSILDAAIEHEIDLEHACGGFCACTTCHILVEEGMNSLSPVESDEAERLENKDGLQPNSRLACQSKVHGRIVVKIPKL